MSGPVASVFDYGVDPTGAADSSPAFDAARDALAGVAGPKLLRVPAGTYRLTRPFACDLDGLELTGDGRATVLRMIDYGPAILVGSAGRGIDWSRCRPDGYGVLDGSVAPDRGWARGFATRATGDPNPRYWLLCPCGVPPATFDGGWESVRTLTIDVLFGSLPAPGGWFGLGSPDRPSPWYLGRQVDPGTGRDGVVVWFRTARWGSVRVFRSDDLSKVDATRPFRLSVTIDLTGGVRSVWINGRASSPIIALPAGGETLAFAPNKLASFKVGNPSWQDNTTGIFPGGPRPDLAVFGLCLSTDAPYATDAAGNQVRVDGMPPSDAFRYVGSRGRDRSKILAFLDTSGNLPVGRYARWSCGRPGYSAMGLVQWDHGDAGLPRCPGNVLVRDLAVECPAYGPAGVMVGPIFGNNCTLDNVSIGGGLYGLLGTNDGYKADVRVRRSSITGREAWVQLTSANLFVDELPRGYVHGSAVRLGGCYARIGSILTGTTAPGARTVEFLADASDYAANLMIDELQIDNEGAPNTPVYLERHASVPTCVRIGDYTPGAVDAANPPVLLCDPSPGNPATPPRLILQNVMWADPPHWRLAPGDGRNEWRVIVDGGRER